MAEEIKLMKSTDDTHVLLRLHRANYDIFRAETEEAVNKALFAILQKSLFITAYYTVSAQGFNLVHMFNPHTGQTTGLPAHVEAGAAEIAAKYSQGPVIATLSKTELTTAFVMSLQEANCERAAFIPVIASVETIGLIILGAQAGQALTTETIEPFVSLADLLPRAYENVRAARATLQRLHELETISTTANTISTAGDLDTLYRIIHQQIRNTMGDIIFVVALYDATTDHIRIPYLYEDGKLGQIDPFPLGEGITSILIRTHQPLMIVEDTANRMRAMGAKLVGQEAKSWMGCPLIVGGNVIGALILQDSQRENRFDQNDLRLLIALSAQVAGAIFNARLLDESRRRALQLQTAAEISRDVSMSLIVDDLLRKAVTLIRDRFSFYHAAVFLVEDDYAVVREATGDAGVQLKHARHRLQIGSKSIIGTVTASGEALVVNDTTNSPTYYQNPLLPETRAEAALPLRVGERVIGAIDVQSTRPFSFSDEDIKILQILADQLAVAIMNSELYAEAQERLSQHRLLHHVTTAAASSTTIEDALQSAVQGLQVTLGGDQISILLTDREHKNLEVRSAIGYTSDDIFKFKVPFGVGVTGWVANHRRPARLDDVAKDARYIKINDRVRSELAVPLIYRNEVLGVLNVESTRPKAYNETDEEILGTLGGSLAAIIAHSRLLEQFRRQAERERLLYEVTSKIRRSANIQTILATTANELTKSLGARRTQVRIDLQSDMNNAPENDRDPK
jgi:GAF domain-containing protein